MIIMSDHKEIHEEILLWIGKEFKEILDDSEQAIYIYVCDRHKLCNKRFSSMLGYDSPEEWAMKEEMLSDVTDEDREILISAYQNAMENKIGSSIDISLKNQKVLVCFVLDFWMSKIAFYISNLGIKRKGIL